MWQLSVCKKHMYECGEIDRPSLSLLLFLSSFLPVCLPLSPLLSLHPSYSTFPFCRSFSPSSPSLSSPSPSSPSPSSLSLIAYTHPCGTPLQSWSVEDVGEFLTALGYEAYVDKFLEHEIDGKALSLVQDHHLLMTMKLRLGPTLKIIEHVNAIKTVEEIGEEI